MLKKEMESIISTVAVKLSFVDIKEMTEREVKIADRLTTDGVLEKVVPLDGPEHYEMLWY